MFYSENSKKKAHTHRVEEGVVGSILS